MFEKYAALSYAFIQNTIQIATSSIANPPAQDDTDPAALANPELGRHLPTGLLEYFMIPNTIYILPPCFCSAQRNYY